MLEVSQVTAGYKGVPVLHDVSLSVPRGQCVALLGLNGAGKSTLMNVIAGIHKPWSGRISINGQDVTSAPSHKRLGSTMSLVPEGRELFQVLTVEENLNAALAACGASRKDRRARIEEATELFPILQDKRAELAGLLSGGQQQMLAIARALVGQPQLLLLDEPSLGLAPGLVAGIYTRLRELLSNGLSMLIVEQHVHEVMGVADQMYVMELGQITASGTPASLQADQGFVRSYLGQ